MWVKHLSSLQFLSYAAFFGVVIAAVFAFLPGPCAPCSHEPFTEEELGRHDGKLAKYFVTGGAFLVLGSVHMVVKNLPWTAEWLASAGYAGHLVRDLSNTHLMIVGGGTLIATGLCWYVLPRIVGRPLASDGLAQGAFWFTAGGLTVFYVAFVANGIAIGMRVRDGWEYQAAKASMGDWYRAPVGMGAGVMGIGYWCFAATVFATDLPGTARARPEAERPPLEVPRDGCRRAHGRNGAGRDPGPACERGLALPGRTCRRMDRPDRPCAHQPRHRLTMLTAGALFYFAPLLGGRAPVAARGQRLLLRPPRGLARLLRVGHVPRLPRGIPGRRAWPHPGAGGGSDRGPSVPDHGRGHRDARRVLVSARPRRAFVSRCARARHAASSWPVARRSRVGTLQGPIQAFPAVHDLLDRGGDAGGVIVNLHAQLNMLGGLLAMLVGLALALLARLGGQPVVRAERVALAGITLGVATYYARGNRDVSRRGPRRRPRRELPRRRGEARALDSACRSFRSRSPCWQGSARTRSAPGG